MRRAGIGGEALFSVPHPRHKAEDEGGGMAASVPAVAGIIAVLLFFTTAAFPHFRHAGLDPASSHRASAR
jgi:hypothetical protein